MTDRGEAVRRGSFKEDYLAWLVVRHFLTVEQTRELLDETVQAVSGDRLRLGDLFTETMSFGEPALSSWAIRIAPSSDRLGRYLQEFVRAVVWQGDGQFPSDGEWSEGERAVIRGLSEAKAASTLDLTNMSEVFDAQGALGGLHGLLTCMRTAKDALRSGEHDKVLTTVGVHFPHAVLRSVVFKHLGDLFVDSQSWPLARTMYEAAARDVSSISDAGWRELTAVLAPAIAQSLAGVERATQGAAEAAASLKSIETNAVIEGNWVALANVADDLFDAAFSAGDLNDLSDRRVAILSLPNLATEHHLSRAMETWQDRRYEDAYRWFWAGLRRQTATGSAQSTTFTKSHFGRCIIEGTHERFETTREIGNLRLGIRLLIEGGSTRLAERTEWSDAVVACIDRPMLDFAISAATSAPGYETRRVAVLLVLFTKWSERLQPEAEAMARAIMEVASKYAEKGLTPAYDRSNVASQAFKTLLAMARAKPEFRSLAVSSVVSATLQGVADRSPIVRGDALKVAYEYSGGIEIDQLVELTEAVLIVLRTPDANTSGLIVGGPAVNFLYALYGRLDVIVHGDLRRRVADALLTLSAEGSSLTAYLSVLQHLDDDDAQALGDPERLRHVIDVLCENAVATNRSDASTNMAALLEAPGLVGWEGIRSALQGLHMAISSAVDGRPAAAFSEAYRPLMSLARNVDEIIALDETNLETFNSYRSTIFDDVASVWRRAEEDPRIFKGFAIPVPTTPDRTIVHNWAFGSLTFARSVNREQELREALEAAARNPFLSDSIAIAQVVEAPIDTLDFGPDARAPGESKDAFYAALGRRVVAIGRMPIETRSANVKAMIEQCYRLGPRGEDAAVFVMAVHSNVRIEWNTAARDYARRLENDRQLRLTLGPLLSQVTSTNRAGA